VRADTARSEFYPLIRIGIFSNRYMNIAVLSSFVLLLAVIYIPFLQPVFRTVPLTWTEWSFILPLLFVPSLVAEINKYLINYSQKRRAK
jgi:Ca2+-transporting ATPase